MARLYKTKQTKKMNKRNIILLICAAVLAIGCLLLVLWKKNVFNKSDLQVDMFAVQDTATITRVFMADMHENTVLLTKTADGWRLSDTIPVIAGKVESLLSTMQNLRVQQPASKNSIENVNRMMAVSAIKVEIYENAPLFTLFKKGFFVKERRTLTYYMGPATQSNTSNYAILEGREDMPCIVYIPGFRGFVTPRYSPFAEDWISHKLFDTKLTRIQEVVITDYDNPAESFRIEKAGARFFHFYDGQGQMVAQYDTNKVINYLSDFRNRNYESVATEMAPDKRDSIIRSSRFKTIKVTDVNGKTDELTFYRMDSEYDYYDASGNHIDDIEMLYNRDRCYATLNGDKRKLYRVQYYHFDRLLQPFSYFVGKTAEPSYILEEIK